ncbi:MAG: NADAR family protein [Phycisphaerales bacterium]|nr:NADAR family protein [Phycisphaerales bacterium]
MAIRFYSKSPEYREFSNFAAFPFEHEGLTYPTVEHFFQAMKFEGTPYADQIRAAKTPAAARTLGRSRAVPIRPDWEGIKVEIMRTALRLKFAAHAELQSLLLATGDEELIEAAPRDYFWGCGARGTGRNMLGTLLMELRGALRSASP